MINVPKALASVLQKGLFNLYSPQMSHSLPMATKVSIFFLCTLGLGDVALLFYSALNSWIPVLWEALVSAAGGTLQLQKARIEDRYPARTCVDTREASE